MLNIYKLNVIKTQSDWSRLNFYSPFYTYEMKYTKKVLATAEQLF